MPSASDNAELWPERKSPERKGTALIASPGTESLDEPRGSLLAPALARLIVAIVFAGFCLLSLVYVVQTEVGFVQTAVAFCLQTALLSLQLFYFCRPGTRLRSRTSYAFLGLQACLCYLPLLQYGPAWIAMPSLLAGSVLLALPTAAALTTFTAVAGSMAWIQWTLSGSSLDVAYTTASTILAGLEVYGLTRLARLITELHVARTELATSAVAHERLRFARDLHDLLGLSLSAIAPKCETAHRLAATDPIRASAELTEILDISRHALADVRTVASGYRELSLDEETRTVESVLAASNVVIRMDVQRVELPVHVRTLLAAVLREGVTNVLRHSKVERCDITLRLDNDLVSLDIVNDGVPAPASAAEPREGGGINHLAERAATLGGALSAGVDPDRRFRLHVSVPVHAEPAPGRRGSTSDEPSERIPRAATHLAVALGVAVFCGYFFQKILHLAYLTADVSQVAISGLYLFVLLVIQLYLFRRPGPPLRALSAYGILLVQAVLIYLPLIQYGKGWVSLPGFLAGSALLLLRPVLAWPLFVVVVGSVGVAHAAIGSSSVEIVFNCSGTVHTALVMFGVTWMTRSLAELRAARRQLAQVAVAEERLRFARDLHDLLGLSLSAITLKCELAHRLMTVDPARAQAELLEILSISRQAAADVRSVATGYSELSLSEESRSAESVLASADVEVRMDLHYGELPAHVRTLLATVLREGVTNVLRHSKGEHCEITVQHREGVVCLDIVNDGVPDPPTIHAIGSGIHNLSDRVAMVGGELTAQVEPDGRFRLRATVPA